MCGVWRRKSEARLYDCIVIGAGAAGLAAARALADDGKTVLVLEAQDRIGGRIQTETLFADFPVELGAEFIHGEGAATHRLLHAHGLTATDAPRAAGMWWAWNGLAQPRHALPDDARATLTALENAYADLASFTDDISLADYLRQRGFDKNAIAVADVLLAQTCCASVETLSTADLARELHADTAGKREYRIREGYSALLDAYAAGLEVRLNQPVRHIVWGSERVIIETTSSRLMARTAIVTVPLSILQSGAIAFSPPLSAAKQAAIGAMIMRPATKLLYRFESPVWDPRMTYLLQRGRAARWWTNRSVIICYVTGDRAEAIDAMPERAALSLGLTELSAMLNQSHLAGRVLSSRRVSWAEQPYIGGGYAAVPPGAASARLALAAPEGKTLFFAGEATAHDSNPQTVHGAFESGWRAAREVAQAL